MAEQYRYAAFISYSSKDNTFARRLHRALEKYRIPPSLGKVDLIGDGKKNRIYPVFRDREELPAGHLGDQIEANLKASAALIVVCSPNSAASPWVQKEIEFFAAQGRHARIFAIIPDTAPLADENGADATKLCFPPALSGDALGGDKLEPLAADARKGRDGFRNAWLKLVAGLINMNAGALRDRDREQVRRQRARAAVLSVVALGLTIFGAWYAAERTVASGLSRAMAFASEADARLAEGGFIEAMQLSLAGNPSSRGWIEHFLSPAGYASARSALVASTAQNGLMRRFAGHKEVVQTASFSQDGGLAVTASYDGTVRLWDVSTGVTRRIFQSQFGPVWCSALSRDGALIIAGLDQNAAVIWDAETGAVLHILRGHNGPINTAAFSSDGSRALTGSSDATAKVWDVRSGAEIFNLAHDASVVSAVFSSDDTAIVTGSGDDGHMTRTGPVGMLRIWDAATGLLRSETLRFADEVNQVVITRNDSAMAVAMENGAVYMTTPEGWEVAFQSDSAHPARSIAFSPDGRYLAVGAYQRLTLLDTEVPGEVALTYAMPREIRSVAFAPDGQSVLAASGGAVAELWSVRAPVHTFRHDDYVGAVAFSPDGARVVTGSFDHTAKIWNARTGALIRSIQAGADEFNPGGVTAAAFSPDGKRLLVGTEHTLSQVFEIESGLLLFTVQGGRTVDAVAFTPDGGTLITAAGEAVTQIDGATGRVLRQIEIDGGVRALALSSDGARLVIGQNDGIQIRNISDGALVRTLPTEGEVVSIAMLPNSEFAMVGLSPSSLGEGRRAEGVQIVDLETGVFRAWSSARPSPVAISANGRLAMIGAELWDVQNMRRLQTFHNNFGAIRSVAISPDGKSVVMADSSGNAMMWNTAPIIFEQAEAQIDMACERLAAIGANAYSDAVVSSFPELRELRPCSTARRP